MEGAHGELGTGLADRLSGDNAYGFARFDGLAGSERRAIGGSRYASVRLVGEWRKDSDTIDRVVVADRDHHLFGDLGAGSHLGAVSQLDVVGERPAEKTGLKVGALASGIWRDVFEPDATNRATCFEWVFHVDDEFLSNVDESTGQVARVSGTKCGIDEALTSTWRSNVVLEHREAFAEVALDWAWDHIATRVRNKTTHTGDLTNLHHVSSSTRGNHHVDRVEVFGLEALLHLVLDLLGCLRPDLDLFLSTLTIGDDAATELGLDLLGVLLVCVEDAALGPWGLDVVDRDREARLRRVPVAKVLDAIERCRNHGLRVFAGERIDDVAHDALADWLVDVTEVVRQNRVEQNASNGC